MGRPAIPRYRLTRKWNDRETSQFLTNKREGLRLLERFIDVALVHGQELVDLRSNEVIRSYGMRS